VDAAIRLSAADRSAVDLPKLVRFVPFDPATKMSEASATGADGASVRIVKGAFSVVKNLAQTPGKASDVADELERKGFRVLAVAAGPEKAMRLAGFIALSDPPRTDSAALSPSCRRLAFAPSWSLAMPQPPQLSLPTQWV
jgi:H+-transporting ATPase